MAGLISIIPCVHIVPIVKEPLPNAKESVYRCDKKAAWFISLLNSDFIGTYLEDFSFIRLSTEHLDVLIILDLLPL